MEKINFTNGQAPAINGTNLNQLQTNVEEAISDVSDYSTEEKVIGTWVDGKPIYRRVFTGTLENKDTTNVTNGLRANNCEIIKAYGVIGDNTNVIPIGHYVNDAWYSGVWLNTSLLYLYVSSSLYGKPYKLIVEYLKK